MRSKERDAVARGPTYVVRRSSSFPAIPSCSRPERVSAFTLLDSATGKTGEDVFRTNMAERMLNILESESTSSSASAKTTKWPKPIKHTSSKALCTVQIINAQYIWYISQLSASNAPVLIVYMISRLIRPSVLRTHASVSITTRI